MLGPTQYHRVPVLEAWDETAAFRGLRLALPLAVFFGLQRHFVRGILVGAVKG